MPQDDKGANCNLKHLVKFHCRIATFRFDYCCVVNTHMAEWKSSEKGNAP